MKKVLILFAMIAFVGLSTQSFAQEANNKKDAKATKISLKTTKTEKKASCCASKDAKASCSKDAKAEVKADAKGTKVSMKAEANAKAPACDKSAKKGCCASKAKVTEASGSNSKVKTAKADVMLTADESANEKKASKLVKKRAASQN